MSLPPESTPCDACRTHKQKGFQERGRALRFASRALRADREVVLAATTQRGSSLDFAVADLRSDENLQLKLQEETPKMPAGAAGAAAPAVAASVADHPAVPDAEKAVAFDADVGAAATVRQTVAAAASCSC